MTSTTTEIAEKFAGIPGHSRVWIYQSDRELTESEVSWIEENAKIFLKDWNAHGAKMSAKLVVLYHRFIVLAADESQVQASGCSIDSSVKFIKSIEQSLQIDLFNRTQLAYRNDSRDLTIKSISEFEEAVQAGDITPSTVVYNNLVSTVDELVNNWEVPASDSWHRRMF